MPDRHLMQAMVMHSAHKPLQLEQRLIPRPAAGQVLVRVRACGVCRTDLHILDGELAHPKLPLIPGHEITGEVAVLGENVVDFQIGDRVGIPWLGWSCGNCRYCRKDQENLCDSALFTGYTLDGGYSEFTLVDQCYCFPLPDQYSFAQAAPLLCAGLIGYRSYRMAGEGIQNLGIYGFGAAAHIITQVAVFQGKSVFAFTSPEDHLKQAFARRLGAIWAGGSDEQPPEVLDAAIIFAPVGSLIPTALQSIKKGGSVICGGIHMSDIPSFPYHLLWEERSITSVANLTRRDGEEFLQLASAIGIQTEFTEYPLTGSNQALQDLRSGKISGAAVLII